MNEALAMGDIWCNGGRGIGEIYSLMSDQQRLLWESLNVSRGMMVVFAALTK